MNLARYSFFVVTRTSAACVAVAAFTQGLGAQVIEPGAGRPRPGASSNAAMIVSGHVRDIGGKPLPGGRVMVVTSERSRSARPIGIYLGNALPLSIECHGPGEADQAGKFKVVVPGARSGVYDGVRIYATAPGHGSATQGLSFETGKREVELKLGPEHLVRGTIIDLKEQPVVGASIRVVESDWWLPPPLLSMWAATSSDDKGRFVIRGLGADKSLLQIEGATITPQRFAASPVPAESTESMTLAVAQARRLRGRVIFGDSGKPAVGATIVAIPGSVDARWLETRTDQEGRFSINPFPPAENGPSPPIPVGAAEDGVLPRDNCLLKVFPPPNAQYVVAELEVPISIVPEELNAQLSRGVLVKGRVTEAQSEKPIAGARVQYISKRGAAFGIEASCVNTAISQRDGRFELPVPTDPGHLLVLGPTPDYVPVETSAGVLEGGKPGKARVYADAVVALAGGHEGDEQAVDVRLRRGLTLRGRVLGLDKRPVASFILVSPSYRVSGYKLGCNPDVLGCANGKFELPGCDPDQPNTAYLLDPANRLGATVKLTKQNTSEPAIVHLRPCGSARARLVGADGKPLANYRPWFVYLLASGVPPRSPDFYEGDHALEADSGDVQQLDLNLFVGSLVTNDDGRITLPALVPGLSYRIQWFPSDFTDPKPWPHLDFKVEAGEVKELGTVVIKPQ
jgi:hypothetical protein